NFPPMLLLPTDAEQEKLADYDRQDAAIREAFEPESVLLDRIRDPKTPLADARQAIADHLGVDARTWEKDYQTWLDAQARVAKGEDPMEIRIVTGKSGGGADAFDGGSVVEWEGREARVQEGAGLVRHVAD